MKSYRNGYYSGQRGSIAPLFFSLALTLAAYAVLGHLIWTKLTS